MEKLSLSGKWGLIKKGDSLDFFLPGSACENKVGVKKDYYDSFSKEAVRTPIERYECVEEIILQKEVIVPKETEGKSIRLFLERVNVSSKLFIDGVMAGREILGLSTPHIYDLTGKLTPGKHIFKLVLNSADLLSLSNMASGYSVDTQGYWNGAIGKIELQWEDMCHIEDVMVFPEIDGNIKAKFILSSDHFAPEKYKEASLVTWFTDCNGKKLDEQTRKVKLYARKQYWNEEYTIQNPVLWSEFNPKLYELHARLELEGHSCDEKVVSFGIRKVEVTDKHILLNGKRIAIRGTVDCAQFPKTGYPPMTEEIWIHNLEAIKRWGLNTVRFHGWCPPEAAFSVADRIGLYLQVEMPLWLNKDVTPLELGDDPIHSRFFIDEAKRIIKTYGNHPSFMFFSNGNENMGDYTILEDITAMMKSLDNRHLYAVTSNFDHPVTETEDYFTAMNAYGNPVRIQNIHDEVSLSTCVNFDQAIELTPAPLISFEVGQYAVYPDVDIIEKYDGNMLPVNFDVIKKEMIKAGVYEKRSEYIKASGDMAWRLYKEDVEASYRTKDMNGYQLLAIQDYTGQYTATVGMLDVMYNDKGIVPLEKWREFVSPVVPLFEAKRIFSNKEKLVARLGLYDYGEKPIEKPRYIVSIMADGKSIYEIEIEDEQLEVDLSSIQRATMLDVSVRVNEYKNTWNVYVFTEEEKCQLTSENQSFGEYVSCQYIPVFWSPVMFETDMPSGFIIDNEHPSIKGFPSGKYPDYQWKTILDNAKAVDLSKLDFEVKSIIELVPNFEYNLQASTLFENEECLYCGLNLELDDMPTRCIRRCIKEYIDVTGKKLVII